jgi:hypothetical protein
MTLMGACRARDYHAQHPSASFRNVQIKRIVVADKSHEDKIFDFSETRN